MALLGAGFNAQAGRGKGWADLLAAIKRVRSLKLEIPAAAEVMGNTTLVWEAMLLELSRDNGNAHSSLDSSYNTSSPRFST